MLLQAPSWELRFRILQVLRARFSEVPVSSRLVPSEQHCFPTSKAVFEPHLKRNFQRQHQAPQTPFSKGSSLSATGTPPLSFMSEALAHRRWFGGTEMEGRMEGGLSDNSALSCQKEFSSRQFPSSLRLVTVPIVEVTHLDFVFFPSWNCCLSWIKFCFNSCSNQKCCRLLTLMVVFLSKILF